MEEFVDGECKTFPSVQCRITPMGETDVISTHDQVLGGESGHVFLGAHFPADKEYAITIGEMGKQVAKELKKYGVLGRFGVDFISVKENNTWKHSAIEINLRKCGTTHPCLMLQFLTDGDEVSFHMIGALSQYGKLGILCIGATPGITMELYNKTVKVLDREEIIISSFQTQKLPQHNNSFLQPHYKSAHSHH